MDVRLYPRDGSRGAHDVQLRSARDARDILLRLRPNGASGWDTHNVRLYAARYFDLANQVEVPPPEVPPQFAGLRTFYNAAVRELSLVASADAPTGMGGVLKINKAGTLYAAFLVETSDPNASSIRVRTSTGTKSIRLKT